MDSESKHNVQLAQEDMRPLNICDALRYLDALKARMQIIKRLDVYNSFLDTMRDFQAQKYVLHFLCIVIITSFVLLESTHRGLLNGSRHC